jgi:hypothetical protein
MEDLLIFHVIKVFCCKFKFIFILHLGVRSNQLIELKFSLYGKINMI